MNRYVFFFLFLFSACSLSDRIGNQNLSYIYKKNGSLLHPEFSVYHFSDDSTVVSVKCNTSELLCTRIQNTGATDYADISPLRTTSIQIAYRLLKSYDTPVKTGLVDSAALFYHDTVGRNTPFVICSLKLKTSFSVTSLLELNITDINRKQTSRFFINIDKTNKQCRQFMKLQERQNDKTPVFKNYINATDTFYLASGVFENFFVHYYYRNFSIAAPPFIINNPQYFDYAADSVFTIHPRQKLTAEHFQKKGFYHFRSDTTVKDGFTLFRFSPEYPAVTSVEQLLSPLRYLTTKKEYEELTGNPNKKQAVDKFWMDIGGNFERAKELIRKFYNRVQEANIYFSSYQEGWETDRGLIYIIFGAPNVVYRTSNSESWIYGEENSMSSVNFTFVKVRNPFTDNDFTLNRSPVYENSWYNAVDMWRQGRVFNE